MGDSNWSKDVNLFVDQSLNVFWFDLASAQPYVPLKMQRKAKELYDGPMGEDFTRLLSSKNLHVNCQGKVVVGFTRNNKGDSNYYLPEKAFDHQVIADNTANENFVFPKTRVPGTEFREFLRRMNRTFVNSKGEYVQFSFSGAKFADTTGSGLRYFNDNIIRYYDKSSHAGSPFKKVQFNADDPAETMVQRSKVALPTSFGSDGSGSANKIVTNKLNNQCAFVLKEDCFVGRITKGTGTFRDNALVTIFFEQSNYGEGNCYVDALATTFFVMNDSATLYKNVTEVLPEFL